MDREKIDWLKQIGAKELNPPYKFNGKELRYRVPIDDKNYMYYSKSYLNETPLDELKRRFEKWCFE
jgi:hypothetical protein